MQCASFESAARLLAELTGVALNTKRIERLVQKIGAERIAERDADADYYFALPLVEQESSCSGASPAVAMVAVDGGRYQKRDWPRPADVPKPDQFWREDRVAVLATFTSEVHAADPAPQPPEWLLQLDRAERLARQIGKVAASGETPGESLADITMSLQDSPATASAPPTWRPKLQQRNLLATAQLGDRFGELTTVAAWSQDLFAAPRQAFLGDGLASNWTIHRQHFPGFTPILDFIHALTYVYGAALAGRSRADGRPIYRRWITAVWQGRVGEILPELAARAAELGPPPADAAATDPRQLVAVAHRYLENQQGRMKYDEYRRQGLPITSCLVESAIHQLNRRVKGTEKFWSAGGAEAILQLNADSLSDDNPLPGFWRRRESGATGHSPYQLKN